MMKPAIAIISNSHTPYRLHLHQRIVRELAEIQLWSVYTHEWSNAPWRFEAPPEIRPVQFGPGESAMAAMQPARALHEWRKGGRIVRWLKEQQVKALVVLGYNDPARVRILRWAHRAQVPCFLFGDSNVRGDAAVGAKRLLKNLWVSSVVKHATGVMPCGRLGAEYFQRYGATPDRTFFFPYEPDYSLFQAPFASERQAAAESHGWLPERRRFLFSGRLVPAKGVETLLEAFIRAAADIPAWDLILAGEGPLRSALEARVPEALKARVRFLGFVPDAAALAKVYRACDVLVLPSVVEPWAVVINEAVSSGLAVVASEAVGAAFELVQNGVNGQRFEPGDTEGLTRALLDVSHPERLETYQRNSLEVLQAWREKADPVEGLRRALRFANVLSGTSGPIVDRGGAGT